jgi:hypothetical protein
VIQRREQLRFPLKTCNSLQITSKDLRENLHRDAASKLRVARLIDLSHSAGTELRLDVVMKKLFTDHVLSGILCENQITSHLFRTHLSSAKIRNLTA